MSVNSSNSTSVFFKAACHANPGAERNLIDRGLIHLNFLFQNLYKLFLHACNVHL